jgi:hypothetical protein
MSIVIDGTTGISSIGSLSGVTSISATNAALTGITSVASNAADTPVILQDSSSNSATCRAWVNFNGTGTPAIRADFNVSSIGDVGPGQFTVNFSNAMPDANYSTTTSIEITVASSSYAVPLLSNQVSGSVRINAFGANTLGTPDPTLVCVAVFR